MRSSAVWSAGAVLSLAAHAALVALIHQATRPVDAPEAAPMEAAIRITTFDVEEAEAHEVTGPAEAALAERPSGPEVAGGAIPVTRAGPVAVPTERVAAVSGAIGEVQALALLAAVPLAPTRDASDAIAPSAVSGARLRPARADAKDVPVGLPMGAALAVEGPASVAVVAAVDTPETVALAIVGGASDVIVADQAPVQVSEATEPMALRPAAMPLAGASVRPAAASALPARFRQPEAAPVSITEPATASAVVAAAALPADLKDAALAWSGAGGAVDPVSLTAIQAFMQPGMTADSDASVSGVRDGIADLLAGVDCARLKTVFVPETGVLEVQGHVPDAAARGPVLALLRQQVGTSIPVSDNLLVLPRPQCGVLDQLMDVGLPQSTDQTTNPRIIGADSHVRVYDFAEGQRLEFDLVAPDYPSVIYIDYFDADGNVLHLQPNRFVGLESVSAGAALTVGKVTAGGQGLNIVVAPPFGEEIMVALATSRPLYEGLRPIQEPAGPYLEFLRASVAEARAADPEFRGEWVYFFVRTRAG